MQLARAGAVAAVILALGAGTAARGQAYIPKGAAPDSIRLLPPPPAKGSKAQAADDAVFKATRKLQGQPRWSLAASDNRGSPQDALNDFACALGVQLDGANAPTLLGLIGRIGQDAGPMVGPPKDLYLRKRPYVGGKAAICVPRARSMDESGSYPSGHTTVGWAWALVLAELAPDRATEILMRGRAYGESRVVCGVHFASDVEAGRTAGAALVAALHGQAAFRADMDKARAEVEAARRLNASTPPRPGGQCALEAEAGAKQPW